MGMRISKDGHLSKWGPNRRGRKREKVGKAQDLTWFQTEDHYAHTKGVHYGVGVGATGLELRQPKEKKSS